MNLEILPKTPDISTAQRVERALREQIIRLELLPGSRLSEQDIADRYGVSRQPVREALIALGRTELVAARRNHGTVVARISVQRMLEARFVREAVEVAVARRAAGSFDPFMRERLAANLDRQAQAAAADADGFRLLDEQFHVTIAKGAGCGLAWLAIADMKAHMDRVCNLTLKSGENQQPLLDQHRAIVAAIDARDADAAEQVMRQHLQEILADLPAVEAQYPELFE